MWFPKIQSENFLICWRCWIRNAWKYLNSISDRPNNTYYMYTWLTESLFINPDTWSIKILPVSWSLWTVISLIIWKTNGLEEMNLKMKNVRERVYLKFFLQTFLSNFIANWYTQVKIWWNPFSHLIVWNFVLLFEYLHCCKIRSKLIRNWPTLFVCLVWLFFFTFHYVDYTFPKYVFILTTSHLKFVLEPDHLLPEN